MGASASSSIQIVCHGNNVRWCSLEALCGPIFPCSQRTATICNGARTSLDISSSPNSSFLRFRKEPSHLQTTTLASFSRLLLLHISIQSIGIHSNLARREISLGRLGCIARVNMCVFHYPVYRDIGLVSHDAFCDGCIGQCRSGERVRETICRRWDRHDFVQSR